MLKDGQIFCKKGRKNEAAKCSLVCLMWTKIKSNLNTYINEHIVRCKRIHIKFTTGYLKIMGLERQDIQDFFSIISLLFGSLTVSMPFIFKKKKLRIFNSFH